MSVDSDIYDAFASRLTAFAAAQVPALTVAYPGIDFTRPSTGPWLELAWFPNVTDNYGVGNEGPSLLKGFGQVSVCDQAGRGIAPIIALAGLVIAHYAKGTELAPGKVETQSWMSSILIADERVIAPVTVRYKAFVNN